MPTVTVIPPTIQRAVGGNALTTKLRRVAGYARVSTDSDEQFTSFEAQVDYYTRKIQENPEWKFVRVYTDEGISATNTKRREGFKEMVADALAGKIDLIVTKSVSRFARNTVDSLVTIRKLKENGVETTIGTWHMPLTSYFRCKYGYAPGDFPVADQVFARALTLPLHEKLTLAEQQKVVTQLSHNLSSGGP